MKKLWDYRVNVGLHHQHENLYLSFVLETDSPERALEIILRSGPFYDAIKTQQGFHLVNFSGPNSYSWAE